MFFSASMAVWLVLVGTLVASGAAAEPSLLVYPTGSVVFRYDPSRYQIMGVSDAKYDPFYSVAGEMLWDLQEDRIAFEAYRAPGLVGFEVGEAGRNCFRSQGSRATIVIDGFSEIPRQLNNIVVQFTPQLFLNATRITVNGELVTDLRYDLPRLVVSTPTGDGNYSDTIELQVEWSGTIAVELSVYVDRNGNRVFDGEPGITLRMEDATVPVESATWGALKAQYQR